MLQVCEFAMSAGLPMISERSCIGRTQCDKSDSCARLLDTTVDIDATHRQCIDALLKCKESEMLTLQDANEDTDVGESWSTRACTAL